MVHQDSARPTPTPPLAPPHKGEGKNQRRALFNGGRISLCRYARTSSEAFVRERAPATGSRRRLDPISPAAGPRSPRRSGRPAACPGAAPSGPPRRRPPPSWPCSGRPQWRTAATSANERVAHPVVSTTGTGRAGAWSAPACRPARRRATQRQHHGAGTSPTRGLRRLFRRASAAEGRRLALVEDEQVDQREDRREVAGPARD